MVRDTGAKEGDPPLEESAGSTASTPSPSMEPGEWETRFKYLLADFDNYRRRTERDRTAARTEAEAALLRRLIPLVEGFETAETLAKSLPASDSLRRGLELLGREMRAVLASVAFSAVARVGEPFHPAEHEAVGEPPATTETPEGAVAEIVQQGYRFQGGLLRPAKVLVAHGPKSSEAPTGAVDTPEPPQGTPAADGDELP
jgi:molecular chaperone GrpE